MHEGLQIIAEGKLAVLIDACDPCMGQCLRTPKLLYKLKSFENISLLELYLKRLKDLGNLAQQKYGKNNLQRDPILPVICVNDHEIEEVEQELVKNNYFGYSGLLCFSTVKESKLFSNV